MCQQITFLSLAEYNSADSVFGAINTTDSSSSGSAATDLTDVTLAITGDVTSGYTGTYTMGVHLGTTAVENTTASTSKLSVYPDPATDYLTLTHPVADANTSVRVTTIDGRTSAKGILTQGATTTKIDVTILRPGIYILTVQNADGRQMIKFIKN